MLRPKDNRCGARFPAVRGPHEWMGEDEDESVMSVMKSALPLSPGRGGSEWSGALLTLRLILIKRNGVLIRAIAFWTMAAALLQSSLMADERRFTYSYEPETHTKGAMEFEQWMTLRSQRTK